MLPSYGELMNMTMFMYYLIGICIIMASTCAIVYLFYNLSGSRKITHDIIENVNETVVIYDRHGKTCYVNITFNRENTSIFLQRIDEVINQSVSIPENCSESWLNENALSLFEGEIEPFLDNESVFSWKMCPIFRRNKYLGRIYVFNDITQYKKLLNQLDQKNRQLREALEAQRKYVEVTRRLVAEEERERIMNHVNTISRDYLEQLRESIKTMEKCANGSTQENTSAFEAENDRMIRITREVIGKIRSTAKALHGSV